MITDYTLLKLRKHAKAEAILLRSSLRRFIAIFHFYMTRQNFTFRPFHLELIRKLEERVFEPEKHKRNLYIGMPPRFGKTQITKYFCAWSFAVNPYSNFILTSYGSDLVLRSSKEVRSIINSELYRTLFNILLDPTTTASELWKIDGGGGEFRSVSLEGVVTGFGAGITQPGFGGALLIDDFMKAGENASQAAKKSVISAYTDTLKSRLNKPETPIIIIAQRLAVDDLIGYIEENEREDWEFFLIEGLDEKTGKAAWESKMPAATLLKMKEMTPHVFYSQYQQNPIILGGDIFRSEWWRFYNASDIWNYRRIFITADTAMKTGEQNDFTAIGCFGICADKTIHLLDLTHGKFEAPELEKVLFQMWEKWRVPKNGVRCTAVYIEDKASGTGMIQTIRRKGVPVLPIKPIKDKYTRAMDAVPTICAGLFLLPNGPADPISRAVISEMEAFRKDMSHKHDDIVDMICYGLEKATMPTGFI